MTRHRLFQHGNPLRAWGRRAYYGLQARPDVQIRQLQRRVDVIERLLDLGTEQRPWEERLVKLLTPHQFDGVHLRRFGSANDGGYVLPVDEVSRASGVISVGVGDDNAADVELASRGLTVHAWDHTVPQLPTRHERIVFHRVGLGSSDSVQLNTLDTLAGRSFVDGADDIILMLDAEGAEWAALKGCGDETLRRFSVVAVEFHGLGELLVDPEPIMEVLERMACQFEVVCVHPNNYGAVWRLATLSLPDVIEVVFVRRDLAKGRRTVGNPPVGLLAPCCPDLPDSPPSWVPTG
jgi:hypothetical protein